jgi:hypothetical protein
MYEAFAITASNGAEAEISLSLKEHTRPYIGEFILKSIVIRQVRAI